MWPTNAWPELSLETCAGSAVQCSHEQRTYLAIVKHEAMTLIIVPMRIIRHESMHMCSLQIASGSAVLQCNALAWACTAGYVSRTRPAYKAQYT